MVALTLKTSSRTQPDFLSLPWDAPLQEWPDELAVRLPEGRHRHVVRFIEHEGRYFAFKELAPYLADIEYRMLTYLADADLPVVDLVGVAGNRQRQDGVDLDAILITEHLRFSLPYLHLFAGSGRDGLHIRLIDALAILMARIHLVGFFWGDCSLGNVLFRRDAGALVAYLVDTETGERHEHLTDGQREHDLFIASENIAGGLFELEAMGRLPDDVDPVELVELLVERYTVLWNELTRTDDLSSEEMWKVRDRLKRLNDMGFDTAELQFNQIEGKQRLRFRPLVVEEGHHRRELLRMTGIEAEENQARRLLQAARAYGAWVAAKEGKDLPEALMLYRWLTDRYEPTVAAIPKDMEDKLTAPEFYHQVLDHMWFLSERAGQDVGLSQATRSYIGTVLADLPKTATIIPAEADTRPEDTGSDYLP